MSLPTETCPSKLWARVYGNLLSAMMAVGPMKGAPAQEERDRSTKAYVAAVDALVEDLETMERRDLVAEIGEFLTVRYGRA